MSSVRLFLWAIAATATLVFAGVAGWRWWESRTPATAQQVARDAITGDFSLIDHTGKLVTDEDFRGRWVLAFFGFTHCPDVCPTALNQVALVMNELGASAERIQPLFFTVDPERDTPKVMAEYVSIFHPRIIGLTGTLEEARQAARSYRIYFSKVEQDGAPDGYTMDHSGYLYLMNPRGQFELVFSHESKVVDIVAKLRRLIEGEAG